MIRLNLFMVWLLYFLSLLSVICRYYRQNSSSRIIVVLVYTVSTLFVSNSCKFNARHKNDMNALVNAHTHRGRRRSPHVGLTSNVLPEAQRSQTGVSSEYVQKPNHHWFVLRVTYNRTEKACGIISTSDVQSYMPVHYVVKKEIGKKKRILQPLLPNLLFVYATREVVNSIIKKKGDETFVLKFYLDKTKPLEENGKHPPLTIPFTAMTNFIKATSTSNEHVRIVSSEQCHYKSGDMVKVIDGEFEGVIGKVARIAGQQRVVVEISGLCLVATAYIPNGFLETAQNQL